MCPPSQINYATTSSEVSFFFSFFFHVLLNIHDDPYVIGACCKMQNEYLKRRKKDVELMVPTDFSFLKMMTERMKYFKEIAL